jgi:hypothetical protein
VPALSLAALCALVGAAAATEFFAAAALLFAFAGFCALTVEYARGVRTSGFDSPA